MKSLEERFADSIGTLWTVIAVLVVFVLLSLGGNVYGWLRIKNDEHTTCQVQARGLPAGHHLASAMGDIGALLAAQNSKQELRRGVKPEIVQRLVDLKAQSSAYALDEAKLPQTRQC